MSPFLPLNGLETKISLDFQYFIVNEHVYYLFFMP